VTYSVPNSFLREWGKGYALYVAAGLAAIPAGAAYAVLAVSGYKTWWTASLAVAIGFWCARLVWDYVEHRFFAQQLTPTLTWSFTIVPATAVAAIMLSCPPTPFNGALFSISCLQSSEPVVVFLMPEERSAEQSTENKPVLIFESGV
jgi:hypothetical protein